MSKPTQSNAAAELVTRGVELVSAPHLWLKCQECGREWVPELNGDGELPAGYWRCPAGCNDNKR